MRRANKLILCALVIATAAVGGAVGYGVHRYLTATVPDAYAVWNTANLVNEFMDAHDGRFPRSGTDLRQTFASSRPPDLSGRS